MDKFDTFAAWVGVVAFLLAIPLSIIANLLTPKVQRWWATTTAARANRRLTRLLRRSEELKSEMKEPFELASRILQPLIDALRFGFMAILLGLMSLSICFLVIFNPSFRQPIFRAAGALSCLAGISALLISSWNFFVALKRVNNMNRRKLEDEVQKLRKLFPANE